MHTSYVSSVRKSLGCNYQRWCWRILAAILDSVSRKAWKEIITLLAAPRGRLDFIRVDTIRAYVADGKSKPSSYDETFLIIDSERYANGIILTGKEEGIC